jgi:hypothetical protein
MIGHSQYVIFIAFYYNNDCKNAPHCYVIRTPPVSLNIVPHIQLPKKCSHHVPFLYVALPLTFVGTRT